MRPAVAVWLTLTAATGADCGGDAGLSSTDYADRVATRLCDDLFRCCTEAERLSVSGNAIDPASCQSSFRDSGRKMAMLVAQGAEPYLYSEANARRCLDALAAPPCGDLGDALATACADVYIGQAQAGDLCFVDSYCVHGLVCDFRGATGDAGRCNVPPGLDETCAGTCGPGLRCDPNALHCVALGQDGATCTANRQCASGYCTSATGGACAPAPAFCTGA